MGLHAASAGRGGLPHYSLAGGGHALKGTAVTDPPMKDCGRDSMTADREGAPDGTPRFSWSHLFLSRLLRACPAFQHASLYI